MNLSAMFWGLIVPSPNWRFNADANTSHGFAIFMASVGSLRAARSGGGYLQR